MLVRPIWLHPLLLQHDGAVVRKDGQYQLKMVIVTVTVTMVN